MKKEAIISNEKYAVIKAEKSFSKAFANINDGNEITVIIKQSELNRVKSKRVQKDFRLITFDMVLPFSMVGFIANISTSLAKAKIPIFIISAYSTDHILIKNKYLNKAKIKLSKLGFKLK